MRTAPVLILVWTSREAYLDRYAEPDKGWTDRDAGALVGAVLVRRRRDGQHGRAAGWRSTTELGACFFGVPADRIDGVRAAFGVPDDQLSVGVDQPRLPGGRRCADPGRPPRRGRVVLRRASWCTSGRLGESTMSRILGACRANRYDSVTDAAGPA